MVDVVRSGDLFPHGEDDFTLAVLPRSVIFPELSGTDPLWRWGTRRQSAIFAGMGLCGDWAAIRSLSRSLPLSPLLGDAWLIGRLGRGMRLSEFRRLGRADGWIDVALGEPDCDGGWKIQSSARASSHGSLSIFSRCLVMEPRD